MVSFHPSNAFIPEQLVVSIPYRKSRDISGDKIENTIESKNVEIVLDPEKEIVVDNKKQKANTVTVWKQLKEVVGSSKNIFQKLFRRNPEEAKFRKGRDELKGQLNSISAKIKKDSEEIKEIKRDISEKDKDLVKIYGEIKKENKQYNSSMLIKELDNLYKLKDKKDLLKDASTEKIDKEIKKLEVKIKHEAEIVDKMNPEDFMLTIDPSVDVLMTELIKLKNSKEVTREHIYDVKLALKKAHENKIHELEVAKSKVVNDRKVQIKKLIVFKQNLHVSIPRFNNLKMASYDTGIEGLRTIKTMERTLQKIDKDLRSMVKIKGWAGNDLRAIKKDLKALDDYIAIYGLNSEEKQKYNQLLNKFLQKLEYIMKLPDGEIDSETRSEAYSLKLDIPAKMKK